MYLTMFLPSILLQLAALVSASPLLTARDTSGPACTYVTGITTTPSCPGSCCGWKLSGSTSDFCDASSGTSTISLSSAPSGWLATCDALRASVAADGANYILTTYQPGENHAVAYEDGGCRLEVRIDASPDEEPPRLAAGDVAALIADGIAAVGSGSAVGATGSTRCYGYDVQWRIVPPGN